MGGGGALVRIVRALQILANWGGFCGLNIDVLRDLTLSVGDGRARPTRSTPNTTIGTTEQLEHQSTLIIAQKVYSRF